jgi:hypothetical protein
LDRVGAEAAFERGQRETRQYYVRVVASLIPRELETTITPVAMERMSDAQLEAIIAQGLQNGLDPASDG